jgi:hypothetical protein
LRARILLGGRLKRRLLPNFTAINAATAQYRTKLQAVNQVIMEPAMINHGMKNLLTGVAVVAALAFSAPVDAQWANPSGGNSMGMPGPNPGGPGLTPYSSGQTVAAPMAWAPTPSAATPKHRHARAASHGKMAGHHRGKGQQLTGSTANLLNHEELARLQAW